MARKTAMSKKRRRSNVMGYAFLGTLILMIAVVIWVQSRDVRSRIAAYAEREAQLDLQIAAQEERAAEIAEFEKYAQTKAYAEDQAHEKLGLVKEGEILFKLE